MSLIYNCMNIHTDDSLPPSAIQFLKQCYRFVNLEWQHLDREPLPDQGFEMRFRESCVANLYDWTISQEREMQLGEGLDTASGVLHEVDIVAQTSDLVAILEIKNRQFDLPGKNDIIIFFAKILDYLALNPSLLLREVLPAFMSNFSFDESGLAVCLGLGIHPIGPGLRPLPVLVDSAKIMNSELLKGLSLDAAVAERFEDFGARLNNLTVSLNETWLTNRCGFRSEDTIILKAIGALQTLALSRELRSLNGDCTELLNEFRKAETQG